MRTGEWIPARTLKRFSCPICGSLAEPLVMKLSFEWITLCTRRGCRFISPVTLTS